MPDPYMIRGKMMSNFSNQTEALRLSFDYTHIIASQKKIVKQIKTIFLNFLQFFIFSKNVIFYHIFAKRVEKHRILVNNVNYYHNLYVESENFY